jgi:FixJ family two-component response regulator
MTKPLICVIDDDNAIRAALHDLMRSCGYRAASFGSAEDFLASPEHDDCDCVVSDIQMRGITGIELKERLAADGRETPVIIVTAHSEIHWQERARKAGAAGFFRKPFVAKLLVDLLGESVSAPAGRGDGLSLFAE